MKQHYLTPLFDPRSVAVIGASETKGSVGRQVWMSIRAGGFKGKLFPINLKHKTVMNQVAWKSVNDIAEPIDLAIITTSAPTVVALIEACGKKGIKAVVLMSSDFQMAKKENRQLLKRAIKRAHFYQMHVLGPSVFGLMRPSSRLMSANYEGIIKPGNIALLSQSSGVTSAILDWAESHHVGFSSVISLGSAEDVGVGSALDYLAYDHQTHSILLYVEEIQEARTFMSALRAAARTKPIIALKVGRHAVNMKITHTHSEHFIVADQVFNAALHRAGVVRVQSISELLLAAKAMDNNYRSQGNRLAIVANGMGSALMAMDSALNLQVEIPQLASSTVMRLRKSLPLSGHQANPVDILSDAKVAHFAEATQACLEDPNIDGVLVIFTPQVGTDHLATAHAMVKLKSQAAKPLLLAWMGEKKVAQSRALLVQNQCMAFATPEEAVQVFHSLALYQANQQLLLQTPGPLTGWQAPDTVRAKAIISHALKTGRTLLTAIESKAILNAFHIPVTQAKLAKTSAEAVAHAMEMGFPVAIKIEAQGLIHKTNIEGVVLNATHPNEVCLAAENLLQQGKTQFGDKLCGVTVELMHGKRYGRELLVGVARDRTLGPVVQFGAGGMAAEVFQDVAIALPPLNAYLVKRLIENTRVKQMLGAFRHLPPIHMPALEAVLLRVSEMVGELPELQALDINPLVVDSEGAIAVDARIIVEALPAHFRPYSHMAIHPFPTYLTTVTKLKSGDVLNVRPIRPEDAEAMQAFVVNLSNETRYNRFMSTLKALPQGLLAKFTQIDYTRELALAALVDEKGQDKMIGVARYMINPDVKSCEFAVVIDDHWQGKGLGGALMYALCAAAKEAGLSVMEGEVLASNRPMLQFMTHLGFKIMRHTDDQSLKRVSKRLD
jgi:acetyltransferase